MKAKGGKKEIVLSSSSSSSSSDDSSESEAEGVKGGFVGVNVSKPSPAPMSGGL